MTEQELLQKAELYIKENEAAIVQDIAALVAQRSVEELPKAAPGAPFGPGPRAALDTGLVMAERMGFATNDGDGYVGWAQLDGREEGYLATITHVDVVPEGDGWDGDPYVLREREGWLLGRGVADDKGPSVLCLYAAQFFKSLCEETGQPLRYGLRVLLGCNEESGMGDVDYYLQRQPQPLFCFSPDANFPVCNGEKGHLNGQFVSPPLAGNLLQFSAGLAPNVIPGQASCLVKKPAQPPAAAKGIEVTEEAGALRIAATGVGGHAANPEGTRNAIGMLVDFLLQQNLCTPDENRFLQLLQRLHQSAKGEGLGIATRDEVFADLTINGGVIELKDGVLSQSIDIRLPTSTSGAQLATQLEKQATAFGAGFEATRSNDPFFIPATNPAIQALLGAYNDVSGEKGEPFTMGGGTYARHFANAVSYGPAPPIEKLPDFAGPEHGANEGSYLPHLLQALRVYILAIWRLQAVDFS